jgi:integrase
LLFGQYSDSRIRFLTVVPTKNQPKENFPFVVKAGSSAVKIYRDRKRSGDYFRLAFYFGGKRHRLNFNSLDAAKKEAAAKAAQLARGDVDAVQLTGRDRLIYGRALDAIKSLSVPLDAAATEYAQAAKTLAGHSLLDAANFYMRHHANGVAGRMVSDAIADFWQAKSGAGRSSVYLKEIRYRLGSFARAFNLEVRELVAQEVADYLEGLKLQSRSFNNQLSMLRTFFRFCQARGCLSKHADLLSRIERRSATGSDIEIFTPGELRALLAGASPHVATCLAIQAFAGVRTAELLRITWHDLERRPGFIEVTAKQAKTAARRLIPISKNLADWLRAAPRNGTERLWTRSSNRYFEGQKLAASRAGFAWKANALRHSFISYRVAQARDIATVALEAGNSPRMVFSHYRELCTEREANDWFSILPPQSDDNIIQMPRVCSGSLH